MRYLKLLATLAVAGSMVSALTPAWGEEVTIKLGRAPTVPDRCAPGNIVAAAEPLNAALKAAGPATRRSRSTYSKDLPTGFDTDAIDIRKAFSVNQGPDLRCGRTRTGCASSASRATRWT